MTRWPFSAKATRLILSALSERRSRMNVKRKYRSTSEDDRADLDNDISHLDAIVSTINAQPVKEAPQT